MSIFFVSIYIIHQKIKKSSVFYKKYQENIEFLIKIYFLYAEEEKRAADVCTYHIQEQLLKDNHYQKIIITER